jgi:hypothetical protein
VKCRRPQSPPQAWGPMDPGQAERQPRWPLPEQACVGTETKTIFCEILKVFLICLGCLELTIRFFYSLLMKSGISTEPETFADAMVKLVSTTEAASGSQPMLVDGYSQGQSKGYLASD